MAASNARILRESERRGELSRSQFEFSALATYYASGRGRGQYGQKRKIFFDIWLSSADNDMKFYLGRNARDNSLR